jgi:hypothetical protein
VRSLGPAGGPPMAITNTTANRSAVGKTCPAERPPVLCCPVRGHSPRISLTHWGVSPRWGPAFFPKPSGHHGFDEAATAQELATGAGGCAPSYCRALGATMAPAYSVVVGTGDSVTAATHCACPRFAQPCAAHLPTSAGGPAGAVNLDISGLTAAGLGPW